MGTLGGPLKKDKLWMFAAFEYVHEDASIAYSPNSQAEFTALASLAAQGLIPGVNSIPVPQNTPIPFRDAIGSLRFDWAQSQKSQWFLRGSLDNYTTENNYVQQATLPSTGTTSGSKYGNVVINNTYAFSPNWLGSFTMGASTLHHTEARNQYLGFALAFPFSSTSQTISGFETFGDNQFQTAITAFPVLRNQEKYQFRYDLSHSSGKHSTKFGIDFIHEPVLSGALSGTAETFLQYANDPSFYAANPSQFYFDLTCIRLRQQTSTCTQTPAGDGSFTQSVQRLGFYAQDSWRVSRNLTVNYGLRWDTTFGLLTASGRDQTQNPAYLTLKALQIPLINGAPHDYRKAFAPRLGIAYAPGQRREDGAPCRVWALLQRPGAERMGGGAASGECASRTMCESGRLGMHYGSEPGGRGSNHRSALPHSLRHSRHGGNPACIQRSLDPGRGLHARDGNARIPRVFLPGGVNLFTPLLPQSDSRQGDLVPNLDVYKSDNRSSYDALMIRLQGNTRRASLIAHYTLSSAKTWGCVLGELWDYVNGVCDPLNPFAPGDYGPSGEDVRHRFVLSGIFHAPGGFEVSTLTQAESARPFTITTAETASASRSTAFRPASMSSAARRTSRWICGWRGRSNSGKAGR